MLGMLLKESSDEAFKKGPSKEEPGAVPTFLLSHVPPYTAAPEHQAEALAVLSFPSHRTQHRFKPGKKHCMPAVPAPPHTCGHACNSSQLEENPSRPPYEQAGQTANRLEP